MPAIITIPEKKTGRKGGRMGSKTNSVVEISSVVIDLESRLDHINSTGQVIKSTRNLIFES